MFGHPRMLTVAYNDGARRLMTTDSELQVLRWDAEIFRPIDATWP